MQITSIEPADFDDILALNSSSVPHVNLIGRDELQWFAENASTAVAARLDARLAGFLIGLRPGLSYASPNYQWFCAHYSDFAYIDRVIVSPWARRRGVANALYAAFAAAEADAPALVCEVNLRPENPGSIRFHEQLGFRQVATQEIDAGKKEVSLMEKKL